MSNEVAASPILEVTNLTKHFGGLTATDNVSFFADRKEIMGVIGPNGAGKSTLFNLITGFIRADKGEIQFDGEDITGCVPHQVCRKGIGRTFQLTKPFANSTVLDNVMVGAFCWTNSAKKAQEIALKKLEQVGLLAKAYQTTGNLTVANLRSLELAKALAIQPKLLLLDEVMAGLNPTEIGEALSIIRRLPQEGITVILIEHVMEAVMSTCQRVMVLCNGRVLASGTPKEITNDKRVLEAYLGEDYPHS